jgi:hypothetical protein
MNAEQAGRVLAKCASYDRRKIGDADVIAWFQVLGDLAYDDCIAAVIAHYGDTTDWIMPAHIRRLVMTARNRRLQNTEIPPPPVELLDDPAAYSAALHAAAVAIADGRDPEAAMAAIARTTARPELEAS